MNSSVGQGISRRRSLENRIPPPIVVVVIAAAMYAVARFGPITTVAGWHADRWLRFAIGGLIGGAGLAVLASGFLQFRKSKTTIDPVRLERASSFVTSGIYHYTRNPMYVGFTAMLLGWGVGLAAPWAMLGPAVFFFFTTRFQIVPEERVMRAKFGREYEEYSRRVRRWI